MPASRIPRTIARRKSKPNLRKRVEHLLPYPSSPLAFVRRLPCVACGKAAPSEAAHARTGTDGGLGMKPGDRYAVPLCIACHAKQHRIGELTFWSALRIDALDVALRLWTVSGDEKGGARTIFRARQRINLARHTAERGTETYSKNEGTLGRECCRARPSSEPHQLASLKTRRPPPLLAGLEY